VVFRSPFPVAVGRGLLRDRSKVGVSMLICLRWVLWEMVDL